MTRFQLGLAVHRRLTRGLRRTRAGAQSGISLVELLVVMAIVGLLIGLLLPALQAARESGRQTRCINNLRQIGVGLHHYHDGHDSLPSGYLSGQEDADTGPGWGWAATLLPFVEEQAVFGQIDFRHPIEQGNAAALATVFGLFLCPSDHVPPVWLATQNGQTEIGVRVGPTNYVAVHGANTSSDGGEGAFFRNSGVRFSDIRDGASHTLLVGERWKEAGAAIWAGVLTNASLVRAASPGQGYQSVPIQGASMTLGVVSGSPAGAGTLPVSGTFFSEHRSGGAHFVFADGHVTFIPCTIAGNVYEALATCAGREPFSGEW